MKDDDRAVGLKWRITPSANPPYRLQRLLAPRSLCQHRKYRASNLVVLVSDPTNKPAHDIEIGEAQAAAKVLGLQGS